MPFIERKASGSKSKPPKSAGPRGNKSAESNPRQKSNHVKRQRDNDELRDLQNRIDNFVSPLGP